MKKIKKLILILLLTSTSVFSQFNEIHIGGGLGIGSISGNSPSQSAFNTSLFIGLKHSLTGNVIFRLNYIYASKINSILPENRLGKYYPFQHIFAFTGLLNQNISSFYLQGGIGPLLIQDRVFSDETKIDFGLMISTGIYFTAFNFIDSRIDLGISGNFGETFTNSLASFYLYQFNLIYYPWDFSRDMIFIGTFSPMKIF